MEEFRKIKGYENYSVSNFGNVRNDNTLKNLKARLNLGYLLVNLSKNNKKTTFYIHRLVALEFIENPQNKPLVDHIDNNKSNNNVNNLRWATTNENSFNTKISYKNITGYKGISYNKNTKKYRARIFFNGKEILIGNYDNIDDAIIARYKKAQKLQNDFINECETNAYNIILLKRQKEQEIKELEELEKEFLQIIK